LRNNRPKQVLTNVNKWVYQHKSGTLTFVYSAV
jgi:hypothetical protein